MNTLINMDPWSFLDDMLNVGGNVFRNMRARAAGRFPPVNVFLDDNAMIVDLQLPSPSASTRRRRTRSSKTESSASNSRNRKRMACAGSQSPKATTSYKKGDLK